MSDKFVKATPSSKNSVIYETDDGRKFRFSKGTRTWRNNNPGNLVVGKVSARNGAIGKAGGFAVFPSYDIGHDALLDSLRNEHGNKDLSRLIEVFAPSFENDTKRYLKFLREKTGITDTKKIESFTKDEFERLWKAIELMEGFRKGEIKNCSEKSKITGVKRDKKRTIIAYFIESIGWVTKAHGVKLTNQGKVDAVVAHSRAGNLYLRTRPDKSTSNNLNAIALLGTPSSKDHSNKKLEKALAKNMKFGKILKRLV